MFEFLISIILLVTLPYIGWHLIKEKMVGRPLRESEPGFRNVFIEDDGTASELDEEEQRYLETVFHFEDGNRPYIKSKYETVTPDGCIGGYLLRQKLPPNIQINPMPYKSD